MMYISCKKPLQTILTIIMLTILIMPAAAKKKDKDVVDTKPLDPILELLQGTWESMEESVITRMIIDQASFSFDSCDIMQQTPGELWQWTPQSAGMLEIKDKRIYFYASEETTVYTFVLDEVNFKLMITDMRTRKTLTFEKKVVIIYKNISKQPIKLHTGVFFGDQNIT